MGILDKVLFNPSQCVTYQPDSTKQQVELTLENTSDTTVMFKMKSTRPGVYKMRPVYDVIAAGDKKTVKLIFKGLKANQPPPPRDRYTVVLAPAPSSSTNVSKLWNNHKFHMKLANSELKRRTLMILYAGVNDNVPLPVHNDEDFDEHRMSTHKSIVKKGHGLIDDEGLQGPVPSGLNPTPALGPMGRPVLVMFRPAKPVFEDSETDEEKDDEEVKPTVEENKPSEMKPAIQANKPPSGVTPRKPSTVTAKKAPSEVAPRKSSTLNARKASSQAANKKSGVSGKPRIAPSKSKDTKK